MNWGYKIVFGLGAFMLFIIGAGIYMVSHDTDTLVDTDYYEKSLTYDETIHKKQNLLDDRAKPTIKVQKDTLILAFASDGNKGSLNFLRPDDRKVDVTLPFQTSTNEFKLPIKTFKRGNWNLEIDWEHAGKPYISDHAVFIQ